MLILFMKIKCLIWNESYNCCKKIWTDTVMIVYYGFVVAEVRASRVDRLLSSFDVYTLVLVSVIRRTPSGPVLLDINGALCICIRRRLASKLHVD